MAPDGENLDAYYITEEILEVGHKYIGQCIAIVHRLDDDDDKLVVAPNDVMMTNEEIEKQIDFQEKYFKHEIIK